MYKNEGAIQSFPLRFNSATRQMNEKITINKPKLPKWFWFFLFFLCLILWFASRARAFTLGEQPNGTGIVSSTGYINTFELKNVTTTTENIDLFLRFNLISLSPSTQISARISPDDVPSALISASVYSLDGQLLIAEGTYGILSSGTYIAKWANQSSTESKYFAPLLLYGAETITLAANASSEMQYKLTDNFNEVVIASSSVNILFPPEGSVYADFTNWVVTFSNIPFGTTIGVGYGKNQSSSFPTEPDTKIITALNYISPTQIYKKLDLSPSIFEENTNNLPTWYAYPFYMDASNTAHFGPMVSFKIKNMVSAYCNWWGIDCPNYPVEYRPDLAMPFHFESRYISPSSTIEYINASGTIATTTSRYACSILDFAGCIYNAGADLTDYVISVPDRISEKFTAGYAYLISSTQQVFPLVVINKLKEDIAIVQASSSYADSKIELTGLIFGSRHLVLFSSSTTNYFKTETGLDTADLMAKLIYLTTAAIMILTTVGVVLFFIPSSKAEK